MAEILNISERASYLGKEEEISIVITASGDKIKTRNISLLLVLWIAGGATIIYGYFGMTDEKSKIVTLVWLAFWGYFLYIMGKSAMWQWKGREIIKIRSSTLYYKKDINGRGWVQNYPLDEIKKLEVKKNNAPSWINKIGGDYWNTDCDSISFIHGEKEINFGYKLTEHESAKIVSLLQRAMKNSK
ncbi:MAG: hypothetical protein HY064_11735 [Bacteroidetes bacterium]|nr:hypothetical protein [Bacteroidota bacterium]